MVDITDSFVTPALLDGTAPGLVGRKAELDALGELLGTARTSRSGVLVVRGEPGIGKSVLLDAVAARADGFYGAHAVGVESEMELPYAGLQQLWSPFVEYEP